MGLDICDINPFRPGRALRPAVIAGRGPALNQFRRQLRNARSTPANLVITGAHGFGKSFLIRELCVAAEDLGWQAWGSEDDPGSHAELTFSPYLAGGGTKTFAAITVIRSDRFRVVQFETVSAAVDEALAGGYKGAVVAIDDAHLLHRSQHTQEVDALRELVRAVDRLQAKGCPLALVLAGLPMLADHLVATVPRIARSFHHEPLESLADDLVSLAIARGLAVGNVAIEHRALARVVGECDGNPYLLQAWGGELWDYAHEMGLQCVASADFGDVSSHVTRQLDHDYYGPIWWRVSPTTKRLLLTARQCPYPPLRNHDLVEVWHRSSGYVNVILFRLCEVGLLYRRRYGEHEFTMPRFRGFLERQDKSGHG